MYYCERCREENDWPASIGKSRGRCECCGKIATCNDVSIKNLPAPRHIERERVAESPFHEVEND